MKPTRNPDACTGVRRVADVISSIVTVVTTKKEYPEHELADRLWETCKNDGDPS